MELSRKRYLLNIVGIVQGVGYRPYVYCKAQQFDMKGYVSNKGSSLVIDVEGESRNMKAFLLSIIKQPPKLAMIERVHLLRMECVGYQNFTVQASSPNHDDIIFIPADTAVCEECIRDMKNPKSTRYQYAFTNCTECGPRYSILESLPYDRAHTTMDSFRMCPSCHREYMNPMDRRYHAQTDCCSDCGPSYQLLSQCGETIPTANPFHEAINLIKQGKIVAMKGIGGFHLICDATNQKAIETLRLRKNRPHKPFAIMANGLEYVEKVAYVSLMERELLTCRKRPIVLLRKKDSSILPDAFAPGLKEIGVMLPYTPAHYLLLQPELPYLIMTSANMSGGPIQYENGKALTCLRGIADVFLIHNRDIRIPVEDSVVKEFDRSELVIRRGRGYSPYTIKMNVSNDIFASGSVERNTFCISRKGYCYMSQYLGDLLNYDTYESYEKVAGNLRRLLEVAPSKAAVGLQFPYQPSRTLRNPEVTVMEIQHHHAHMVSCMVEHNLYEPVIGVIYDGNGAGTDGCVWGGEFLIGTRECFTRVGHLKEVLIQGGEEAIREPWRTAASFLHALQYPDIEGFVEASKEEITLVVEALNARMNCFRTTSMGRLFDCVSALLGVCCKVSYSGQAAIELENLLVMNHSEYYPYSIIDREGTVQLNYDGILLAIMNDISINTEKGVISARFHNTIVEATLEIVTLVSERY
ncbi:MAG TPA: carbamoyltransferase HypF, partial [Lachnospiraceae bacterium]|nr:carbamoyltransferase HypF [Lachnospiraceae bacterium]